jgi:hypothetical protein
MLFRKSLTIIALVLLASLLVFAEFEYTVPLEECLSPNPVLSATEYAAIIEFLVVNKFKYALILRDGNIGE